MAHIKNSPWGVYRFTLIAGFTLIVLGFLLSGCLLAALQNPQAASMLTPEQIAAYRDLNVDVVFCFTISGPPPAGNSTFILLPKGTGNITFSDNCHVANAPVIIQTPPSAQILRR